MNNKKILSVKVANKGFACVHPNLPSTHQDGWGYLIKLLDAEIDKGYIPTSLINNTSAGGSCYMLSVDVKKPDDARQRASLVSDALTLGWESVDNNSFFMSDVKNYLINLSNGEFAYPVVDIVYSFNEKGISCTEEEVLDLIKNLRFKTFWDKKITYAPASVNSECMQPMPRMVEEVIFVRPLC